jgi:hypothetical protein
MLRQICNRLGVEASADPDLHELSQTTHVGVLAQGLNEAHGGSEQQAPIQPVEAKPDGR